MIVKFNCIFQFANWNFYIEIQIKINIEMEIFIFEHKCPTSTNTFDEFKREI